MLTRLATVALVAFFSLSPPYQDDPASLRREIEALKAQQAVMQRDLDAIKNFLQQLVRRSPAEEAMVNASIGIAGRVSKGSPAAKVTLVEVSDYHCPFCRRHMQTTQPQIDANYISSGKLHYVFIDYPIVQLHPDAFKAHEAANCANEQGKYWEMHAQMFAAPTKDPRQLVTQAQALGMDASRFRSCLDGGKYASSVRDSVERMEKLGVDSTPTFLLGMTPAPGQPMKILKVVKGAVPFSEFKTAIESLLSP